MNEWTPRIPHFPSASSINVHHHTTHTTTMADQDPSPADIAQRDIEEKERKAREIAEQSQLPYKWTQTIRDVDVSAPIPANIKGRDMEVVLTKNKLKVAIKGQAPIIEVLF